MELGFRKDVPFMTDRQGERRLTTILAADVVGYSRLMGEDEEGTLETLAQRRHDVLEPLITRYGGRLFKLMGDGVLIEFTSVVNAVHCAVDLQSGMEAANRAAPGALQILLRVGINLGDAIALGGDLYGDCVNVASRLQAMAAPAGICLSERVYQHVVPILPLAYRDLGPRSLKNIARPLHVYALGAVGGGEQAADVIAKDREKPSIAVLPLTNMSGDPEQEFFADGLTEDIITELSRFHDLLVISRNSSFRFKGKTVDVKSAASELNVGYLVEGSVRKVGNRVRVTAQLIDALADQHIWAERYDRSMEDIFAIQDEITSAIVAILPGRIEAATRDRAAHKPTENMIAYECVLTGKRLHHRATREDNVAALDMLDRAIKLDPRYAHAHAWKACALGQAWVNNYVPDKDAVFELVNEEAQLALALDDNDSDVHRIMAALCLMRDDHDKAIYHQERALSLNPNDDLIVVQQGEILTWLGRADEGTEWILRAMRLNPYHPERFWSHLGRAHFVARRYAEAIQALKHLSAPDATQLALMAACHYGAGDAAEAARQTAEALKRQPDLTLETCLSMLHYKNQTDLTHHRDSLLLAGLPQ